MYVSSKTLDAHGIAALAERVSEEQYDGNLTVESEPTRGRTVRVKLGTADSYAHGSRRSWSGRHGRWACWHAFRDVLTAIFNADPDATVRTSMTTYRGARGFLANYPGTADQNVGSLMQPAYMPELCDCADYGTTTELDELARKAYA